MANNDQQRNNRRRRHSPFESMFGGGYDPFEEFRSVFGNDFPSMSSRMGYPIPRHREAVDIGEYFSDQTKELIQEAGKKAVDFNRTEVDTEHLLAAITDSDVATEILRQFKIKPPDLKQYIEENAPRGDKRLEGATVELTVSPRL